MATIAPWVGKNPLTPLESAPCAALKAAGQAWRKESAPRRITITMTSASRDHEREHERGVATGNVIASLTPRFVSRLPAEARVR